MYKILILIISITLMNSCRYKDNDKFVLSTVKHRLEKTWYLREYILNDTKLNVNQFNTLKFFEIVKNNIAIDVDNSGTGQSYLLKNNKTSIVKSDDPTKSLKITKLTKDELWLEGDKVITGTFGFNYSTDKIKAKYSSKK